MKRLVLISACLAAASFTFAQQQCVKTAVSLSGDKVTLTTSGAKSETARQNFVYYEKKRLRKHDSAITLPGVAAQYPSEPLMLSDEKDVKPVPEKYNVSVGLPQRSMEACPDSSVTLSTSLNVERVSDFTGNYPGSTTEPSYTKVTKHQYKMAARKKRKIERKEEKIARKAEVNVEVRSTEAVASNDKY